MEIYIAIGTTIAAIVALIVFFCSIYKVADIDKALIITTMTISQRWIWRISDWLLRISVPISIVMFARRRQRQSRMQLRMSWPPNSPLLQSNAIMI